MLTEMEQQVIIVVSEVEQEVFIGNNNFLFHLGDHNNDLYCFTSVIF